MNALLADAVLVLHVGIAAFVVGGLGAVIGGNLLHWRWVNHLGFRIAHLAAIAVIVAESWFGLDCPLTVLEASLRSGEGAGEIYADGFIAHWLQRLLYYSAPPWVFVLAYSVFGLLVAASWWYFPPRLRRGPGTARRE